MTLDQFTATLTGDLPPDVPAVLLALWYDARGDWDRAHRIVQDIDDANAAWVHAYLHRKEGDVDNARYWYRSAGQPETTLDSSQVEWSRIVTTLLAEPSRPR